ncbi:MAG: hypothetical protein JSS81_19810 [Acidobacteria bacterium]|nr:hypothetical protein [Acidobacteriota bacterium]
MLPKITRKNLFTTALTGIVGVGLILGCGGPGRTCVGELTVDGKTYQGRDPSEAQARQNTCSKYCIEGDAGYDRLYQEFIKTPESKKVIGLDKWSAQAENKKLGEYVRQCEQDCLKQHTDGTRRIEVKCQ